MGSASEPLLLPPALWPADAHRSAAQLEADSFSRRTLLADRSVDADKEKEKSFPRPTSKLLGRAEERLSSYVEAIASRGSSTRRKAVPPSRRI